MAQKCKTHYNEGTIMNIINLLIKEKHIVGVEISGNVIRIAYFRSGKKMSKKASPDNTQLPEHELVLIEESIPTNTISEGVVINKELLGKTLKSVWTKAKLNANYAVVAIPENKIYSHIFPFPKTVNTSRLEEAINLAIDFQLPIKKSDAYIGWEHAGNSHVINEIFISLIPKTIADGYIETLHYAGIKLLALESHLASIARSIKLNQSQATLLTKKNPDGTTIFILQDGAICFSRTLPATFIKEDDVLINETEHIKTSFESEKKISVGELLLTQAAIRDEYLAYPEFNGSTPELQSKWLIAIGAAMRGKIPKGKDNYISFLPVGTAQAYAYQKTTTFITLIRNIIIGVSIFFLFTFFAAYLFIFFLLQTSHKTNSNASIPLISQDRLQEEARIKRINLMIQGSQTILSTTVNWSTLLDDIYPRVIDGIFVTNFSVTSVNDQIVITGIAKNRNTLNEFKKSLQMSPYVTEVNLPIKNLEQKGDIPFSISFRLNDPHMLYYQ